jgi:hypothetical protein
MAVYSVSEHAEPFVGVLLHRPHFQSPETSLPYSSASSHVAPSIYRVPILSKGCCIVGTHLLPWLLDNLYVVLLLWGELVV